MTVESPDPWTMGATHGHVPTPASVPMPDNTLLMFGSLVLGSLGAWFGLFKWMIGLNDATNKRIETVETSLHNRISAREDVIGANVEKRFTEFRMMNHDLRNELQVALGNLEKALQTLSSEVVRKDDFRDFKETQGKSFDKLESQIQVSIANSWGARHPGEGAKA